MWKVSLRDGIGKLFARQQLRWFEVAGINSAEVRVEDSCGVGPLRGPERDPKTKGSLPDDARADEIHLAEPKEVTKAKVARAQEEPPDFEIKKHMPGWDKPAPPGTKD